MQEKVDIPSNDDFLYPGLSMLQGQTVNQFYYKNILKTLRKRVRLRRPDLWKNASWILHHDNAPEALFGEKQHSCDGTSLCDFSLFPKVKFAPEETRIEAVNAVKAKATELRHTIRF